MKLVSIISACLLAGLIFVGNVATAHAPKKIKKGYSEIISGRYYMTPRSEWLGTNHTQVHWFLSVNRAKVVERLSHNDPIKRDLKFSGVQGKIRAELESRNLLREGNGVARELYDNLEWRRALQQSLVQHHGGIVEHCKRQLVIVAKKFKQSGDLVWWERHAIDLGTGAGCR